MADKNNIASAAKKKDINILLQNLDEGQQKLIIKILKALQDGSRIKKAELGLMGLTADSLNLNAIAEMFHVTHKSVQRWVVEGCPRNPDLSYSLLQVHNWLVQRETEKLKSGDNLKDQKLKAIS